MRILRVVAAAALAVSAVVHLQLADRPYVSAGQVTVAGLFLAQAVVAGLIALWLALSGRRVAWLVAGAVALASLVALVLSVYVQVPAVGPFPTLYEPLWYPEKVVAAVAAAAALLAATAAARRSSTRT